MEIVKRHPGMWLASLFTINWQNVKPRNPGLSKLHVMRSADYIFLDKPVNLYAAINNLDGLTRQ